MTAKSSGAPGYREVMFVGGPWDGHRAPVPERDGEFVMPNFLLKSGAHVERAIRQLKREGEIDACDDDDEADEAREDEEVRKIARRAREVAARDPASDTASVYLMRPGDDRVTFVRVLSNEEWRARPD